MRIIGQKEMTEAAKEIGTEIESYPFAYVDYDFLARQTLELMKNNPPTLASVVAQLAVAVLIGEKIGRKRLLRELQAEWETRENNGASAVRIIGQKEMTEAAKEIGTEIESYPFAYVDYDFLARQTLELMKNNPPTLASVVAQLAVAVLIGEKIGRKRLLRELQNTKWAVTQ